VPALFTLSFLLVISMVGADVLLGVKDFVHLFTLNVQSTLSSVAWLLSVPLAAMLAGGRSHCSAHPQTASVPVAGSWPHVVFGEGFVLIITLHRGEWCLLP
jgi:hypothetical protein